MVSDGNVRDVVGDLAALFQRYDNFYECFISAVVFEDFQTRLTITFDCGPEHGWVVSPEHPSRLVTLTLRGVHEARFRNGSRAGIVLGHEELGWGWNEVARVEIQDDAAILDPYQRAPIRPHHLAIRSDHGTPVGREPRRIDIVFTDVSVTEQLAENGPPAA